MIYSREDAIKRIEELITLLNYHSELYNDGKPVLTDSEWDDLYFELLNLENDFDYYNPKSPTQNINFNAVSALEKVKHNHPMLSLDKTRDWNEFLNYFGYKDVIGMLKLDGLTCSLTYEDGILVSAETRGDGEIGENIYHNALVIPTIPKKINYKEKLILDGEIICKLDDFKEFENDYKTARNFASGSIRLFDSKECYIRHLTFVVWNVVEGFNEENSFLNKLSKLDNLGFKVVPWTSSFDWDAKEFLIEEAQKLNYPIDGLVGRFDDIAYGESLGATAHHAKTAYAFKFYDEEYETELIDIEWSMSRTGQLTPVAIYNTINIDGTECSKASLHNLSILNEILGIPFKGQKIKVYKANQIIPQISWAEKLNTEVDDYAFPLKGEKE